MVVVVGGGISMLSCISTPQWSTTGLVDASKCYAVLSRKSLWRPSGIVYVYGVC